MGITKSKTLRNLIMFMGAAFFLAFFSAQMTFAEKPGANIVVTLRDRPAASGELLAVREDSLVLMDSNTKAGLTLDFKEIKSVQIVRKSKVLLGMACGAAVGLGISAIALDQHSNPGGGMMSGLGNAIKNGFLASAIILGTTGVGVTIGGIIGTDKVILVEGNSPEKAKKILWELRSKARRPDAR